MATARVNPMKLDVVLLTKNSLKPCLFKCLESIYRNVPVNKLIVVDGGSTDGTLELVRKYPNVEVIEDPHGSRATARQKGIEAVETDWHVHVDSDVILCEEWFKKAWENVADDVGAVWGVAVPNEKHYYNAAYAMAKLYHTTVKDLMVRQMRSERYMMHDTLIRTSTVRDIRIPPDLHTWKDDFIGKHIIKKGYDFRKVKEPFCLHNITPVQRTSGYFTTGYLLKVYHYDRLNRVFRRTLTSIPKSIWILAGDWRFSGFQIELHQQRVHLSRLARSLSLLVFCGWVSRKLN